MDHKLSDHIIVYEATTQDAVIADAISFSELSEEERGTVWHTIISYPFILGEQLMFITTKATHSGRLETGSTLLFIDTSGSVVSAEIRLDGNEVACAEVFKQAASICELSMEDLARLLADGSGMSHRDAAGSICEFTGSARLPDSKLHPRILLAAESFHSPDLIYTLPWLADFGIDISCRQLTPYRYAGETPNILLSTMVAIQRRVAFAGDEAQIPGGDTIQRGNSRQWRLARFWELVRANNSDLMLETGLSTASWLTYGQFVKNPHYKHTQVPQSTWSTFRYYAVHAASESAGKSDAAILKSALGDDNWRIRYRAATELGNLSDASAVPHLVAALRDSSFDVQLCATHCLGLIGDSACVPALAGMLDDSEWRVRSQVADALGRIGDPSSVAPLITALADSVHQVRTSAERALAKAGVAAIPALCETLRGPSSQPRDVAIRLMKRLGDAAHLPRRVIGASQYSPQQRSRFLDALRSAGYAVPGTQILCSCLIKDDDPQVSTGAMELVNWLELLRASQPGNISASDELLRPNQRPNGRNEAEELLRCSDTPDT